MIKITWTTIAILALLTWISVIGVKVDKLEKITDAQSELNVSLYKALDAQNELTKSAIKNQVRIIDLIRE